MKAMPGSSDHLWPLSDKKYLMYILIMIVLMFGTNNKTSHISALEQSMDDVVTVVYIIVDNVVRLFLNCV